MPDIVVPQVRKTSEIEFHNDKAPGVRIVLVDKSIYPKSRFYIVGRLAEKIPKGQADYVLPHRHNCNSFYFFIGDKKDLTGLKAEIKIEGKKFTAESPSTVMIPKHFLHSYKLTGGKGWFFHVVPKPSFEESIFKGNPKSSRFGVKSISKFYKKFEKQTKPPKETERPVISKNKELKNPQRWVLVKPEMFEKPGIYAALHQIFSNKPFSLNQKLHSNSEDEVYLFFSRAGEVLEVNMYSSEREKKRIRSPITVYHPKRVRHKYGYVSGQGFMLVVLKEKKAGEGYSFIA